jgi:glycosyltransferase involved in cell wall biosynthesis
VALISVIVPIHNQAEHLGQIVSDYEPVLSTMPSPYELVIVVNGSTDASLAIANSLAAASAQIRVLHSAEGGWGRAVRLGLREAKGDILCYTNAARTRPEDLQLALLYGVTHPDVVIKANRKVRGSLRRRIGSLLYNLECRTLFDLSNWDINGTPKVFPRKFSQLLELQRDDDLIDLEFCRLCRQANYPMLEIPTFSSRRYGGRSTTGYGSALRMYSGALRMWQAARGPAVVAPGRP